MTEEKEIIGFLRSELGEDLIEARKERERRVFARIKPTAIRKPLEGELPPP